MIRQTGLVVRIYNEIDLLRLGSEPKTLAPNALQLVKGASQSKS